MPPLDAATILHKDTSALHCVKLVKAAAQGAYPSTDDERLAIAHFQDAAKRLKLQELGLGDRGADVLDESIRALAAAQVELEDKLNKMASFETLIEQEARLVVEERAAFEAERDELRAAYAELESLRSAQHELPAVNETSALALEVEALAQQQAVDALIAALMQKRGEIENIKAELELKTQQAQVELQAVSAQRALEAPRRRQLDIMASFCKSKTTLVSHLSGLSLVLGDDGAALDAEGRLQVALVGEGRHRVCVQFDAGKVAACSVDPLVTVDGASEKLAAAKAVRDNDATAFIRQIRRLEWSASVLRSELKAVEQAGARGGKWSRVVLAYKPATRVVTCLLCQGSYQASLLVPVDYPAAPAQLVDFQDLVKFKNVDAVVDKLVATAPETVSDWVHALQKEMRRGEARGD